MQQRSLHSNQGRCVACPVTTWLVVSNSVFKDCVSFLQNCTQHVMQTIWKITTKKSDLWKVEHLILHTPNSMLFIICYCASVTSHVFVLETDPGSS